MSVSLLVVVSMNTFSSETVLLVAQFTRCAVQTGIGDASNTNVISNLHLGDFRSNFNNLSHELMTWNDWVDAVLQMV